MKQSFWLGALLAPLVTALAYMGATPLFPDPFGERTIESALVGFVVFLLPASYFVEFVFGAPLIFILKRFKKLSLRWIVSLAAPLGAVAVLLVLISLEAIFKFFDGSVSSSWTWKGIVRLLGGGAIYGVVMASLFCLLSGIIKHPKQEQAV